jgi:hypothetical protein
MKDLFTAYDDHNDYRVSLGIKLGVLMNGSDKIPEVSALKSAASDYICTVLATKSGIEEIDGKDISKGRPDEEIFRFDGAFDTLGHIMNVYLRRYFKKSDTEMSKMLFATVSKAGILKKLNKEEDFSGMTKVYDIVPLFIENLPIPSLGEIISEEQADVMRDSFSFIHKFYLEFDSKKDGKPALINLLQLSYDKAYVSIEMNEVKSLSSSYVRDTVCEMASLKGIIPEAMKMVCNDIIFAN